jgi:hypothetical protein
MVENYQEFNNFQTAFYTSIINFDEYTKYEFKKNGYKLFNNLAKGYPNLADLVINLKGINWCGAESPGIMKALQRRFINNFNTTRMPQFIYFKTEKIEKDKSKVKKTDKGLLFDMDIQREICSILLIDSKTYDYLKFSDNIQFLGKQLNGEWIQKEKIKTESKSRKTKKK